MTARPLLVRGGTDAEGRPVDVRVAGGDVIEVGGALDHRPGEDVIDAAGGAILPGLHDHHIHLRALAAAAGSVPVGPPEVRTEAQLVAALQDALPERGWVRAVGYHESVAGDLDRWALDRYLGGRPAPVRVQHRSGALWILNSAALATLGPVADHPEGERGRFWRADRWLAERLPARDLAFRRVGHEAAARGVTGFTDATPDQLSADLTQLAAAAERGDLPQRLHLMSGAGIRPPQAPRVTSGPVKVMLDDPALPAIDELVATIRAARADARAVAVHCVTLVQAVLAVAAFTEAGPGHPERPDRIEHGALLTPDVLEPIRRLGLTVVTQPGFVARRGDEYLAGIDASEHDDLWRAGSLLDAGIAVAAGSDAPFGSPDPWVAIRAAVTRRTLSGHVLGPAERVRPATAVRLWVGLPDRPATPRRLVPGAPADLCVLAEPLAAVVSRDEAPPVVATIVAGHLIFK